MSEHTPGPWKVGVSTDVEFGPWPCFRLAEMTDPTDQGEILADVHLIEAVVDLLAALEALLPPKRLWDRCEQSPSKANAVNWTYSIEQAETAFAAIAKARGES